MVLLDAAVVGTTPRQARGSSKPQDVFLPQRHVVTDAVPIDMEEAPVKKYEYDTVV